MNIKFDNQGMILRVGCHIASVATGSMLASHITVLQHDACPKTPLMLILHVAPLTVHSSPMMLPFSLPISTT